MTRRRGSSIRRTRSSKSPSEAQGNFSVRVLETLRRVPAGKVTTYAAIARFLKNPRAVRAVGQALNRNPQLIKIPCHRVVCSDGRVGGYFSGSAKKRRLLADEGVRIKNGRIELKRFGIINF